MLTHHFTLVLGCLFPVGMLGLTVLPGQAQIVNDASLGGAEQSVITSQGNSDIVTGGAVRGSNLFHSFTEFNVMEGRSLYFSPADPITQIFSRVTGTNPSNIDGTLGVLGNADLFLLNPHGILFGPNAQLALSGSFTATAGVGLQFEGFEFSTTQPQPVPLLSVSAPLGINLGQNPGPIVNRSIANGIGLALNPFQTLNLSGGTVALDGGMLTIADGRIELLSAGEISLTDQATVEVHGVVGNPASDIRLVGQDITLDGQSQVRSQNSSTHAGANIVLEGGTLTLMNGSQIATATQGFGKGGSIAATLSDAITVTSIDGNGTVGSASRILTETLGSGNAGNIDFQTGQLLFEYDSQIVNQSRAFTTGNTGNITIQAEDSIVGQLLSPVTRQGGLITVRSLGSGEGGTLQVSARRLTLRDVHAIDNSTFLTGNAGDIVIDADRILLDGVNSFIPFLTSGIVAIAYGTGEGGDIQINTQDLTVQNSASVITAVLANRDEVILSLPVFPELLPLLGLPETGLGNAGNIDIVADTILVDGFDPIAASRPSQISSISLGVGNAGDIDINTHQLNLSQGGVVASSSLFSFSVLGTPLMNSGLGDGGELRVSADRITVTGINSLTELPSLLGTQTGSRGNAGNTHITTRLLNLQEGGAVLSGTFTAGDSGQLTVTAQESITIDGLGEHGEPSTLGTFAAVPSTRLQRAFFLPATPEGDTGELIINSERLTLSNGGTLSAAHQGTGDAGALQVNVNQLLLSQGGQISATSLLGQGGNVELQVKDILALRQGSQLTAEALGEQGNGGNLTIDAGITLALPDENSDIIANAVGGNGGNITLRTGSLLGLEFREQLTSQSDITASSEVGLDGTVSISLLELEPSQNNEELPSALLNDNDQVRDGCERYARSRFILTGRGGLPPDSRQQLLGQSLLEDWRPSLAQAESSALTEHNSQVSSTDSTLATDTRIVPTPLEATGLRLTASGHMQLIAAETHPLNPKPVQLRCSNPSSRRP